MSVLATPCHRMVGAMSIALALLAPAGSAGAAEAAGAPVARPRAPAAAAQGPSDATPALIDINSASRAQLETLPGIGDAEAHRIIAARPYLSKVDLVADAGLPIGVYAAVKHRIVAVQNEQARAKLNAMVKARQAREARGTHR